MILSDAEILRLIENEELKISPFDKAQVQPASVDITLGETYAFIEDSAGGILHPSDKLAYRTVSTAEYVLLPGQFVLATTKEYISLPNDLTAFVEGRSSWGRLGLFIQNAGWVDPGFEGEITLELFNANRYAIELSAGIRIGQLVFAKMEQPAQCPYNGKYQRQRCATGTRIYLEM